MAHIEIWYRCPVCNALYDKEPKADKCRNTHPVRAERWAVGKGGKAVRIYDDCTLNGHGGVNWALREADMSDFIEERKRQLEERQG